MRIKAQLLILVILVFTCCWKAQATGYDKLTHLSVSYALTATGMHLFPNNKLEAALLVLAAGVVKEISDDHVDNGDLIANGLGIGMAVVVWSFE